MWSSLSSWFTRFIQSRSKEYTSFLGRGLGSRSEQHNYHSRDREYVCYNPHITLLFKDQGASMSFTKPPSVPLASVTQAHQDSTHQVLNCFRASLSALDVKAEVSLFGSAHVINGLSRGEIDLLITSLEDPKSIQLAAKLARWIERDMHTDQRNEYLFTSVVHGTVRIFIPQSQSDLGEWRSQQQALENETILSKYNFAKRVGAPLGCAGYAQVKDIFWKTWRGATPHWCTSLQPILKLLYEDEWLALMHDHETDGSSLDRKDGFIHLSDPNQVHETARLHFDSSRPIFILSLDAHRLGKRLVYEASRNGQIFPHLYDRLKLGEVSSIQPWLGQDLPLNLL